MPFSAQKQKYARQLGHKNLGLTRISKFAI